jgi:hypothetical protein
MMIAEPHPRRVRAVEQDDRQQHEHAQRQVARRTEVGALKPPPRSVMPTLIRLMPIR